MYTGPLCTCLHAFFHWADETGGLWRHTSDIFKQRPQLLRSDTLGRTPSPVKDRNTDLWSMQVQTLICCSDDIHQYRKKEHSWKMIQFWVLFSSTQMHISTDRELNEIFECQKLSKLKITSLMTYLFKVIISMAAPCSPFKALRSAEIFYYTRTWKNVYVIMFFQTFYTRSTKGSLLASIIPWRTFNIHGALTFHKRFFQLEKGASWLIKIIKIFLKLKKKCFYLLETKIVPLWKASFVISVLKSVIVHLLSEKNYKKCCFAVFESRHCWIELTFLPAGPSGPMSPLGPGEPCRETQQRDTVMKTRNMHVWV